MCYIPCLIPANGVLPPFSNYGAAPGLVIIALGTLVGSLATYAYYVSSDIILRPQLLPKLAITDKRTFVPHLWELNLDEQQVYVADLD